MENRNLQWSKRAKAPLILIFSVNTNHESVAYRSFSPSEFEARGARKVTTGIDDQQSQAMSPASSSRPTAHVTSREWVVCLCRRCSATQLDAGKSCEALGTKC